jgi:hypothetical protein
VKLRELKTEIEESAKNLFGEKAYPITSNWIPVTDVLAIIDRFEKEWRQEFETALTGAKSHSHQHLKELVERIITDLLS